MVGSDLEEQPLKARAAGEVRLELKGYSMAARDPFGTALSSIDLAVRAGEIVGIAGVSGNGQKETAVRAVRRDHRLRMRVRSVCAGAASTLWALRNAVRWVWASCPRSAWAAAPCRPCPSRRMSC